VVGAGGSSGSGCGTACASTITQFATLGTVLLAVSAVGALLSIGVIWTLQRQTLSLWISIPLTFANSAVIVVAVAAADFLVMLARS